MHEDKVRHGDKSPKEAAAIGEHRKQTMRDETEKSKNKKSAYNCAK